MDLNGLPIYRDVVKPRLLYCYAALFKAASERLLIFDPLLNMLLTTFYLFLFSFPFVYSQVVPDCPDRGGKNC